MNGADSVPPQTVRQYQEELVKPFPPEFVKWKPTPFPRGKEACRVRVAPYVDARAIMDRLDRVFGADCWQTTFRELTGGAIECTLSVRFPDRKGEPGEWVRKVDVGSRTGTMPDADDNLKSAYSDALKRAAVHLGVGRYLYRIGIKECQWEGGRVIDPPTLPNQYVPDEYRTAGPKRADAVTKLVGALCEKTRKDPAGYVADFLRAAGYGPKTPLADVQRRHIDWLQNLVMKDGDAWAAADLPADYPKTGAELAQRLAQHDSRLAKSGAAEPGELSGHVAVLGVAAGYGSDPATWTGNAQIRAAVEWAKNFISARTAALAERKAARTSHASGTPSNAQTSA